MKFTNTLLLAATVLLSTISFSAGQARIYIQDYHLAMKPDADGSLHLNPNTRRLKSSKKGGDGGGDPGGKALDLILFEDSGEVIHIGGNCLDASTVSMEKCDDTRKQIWGWKPVGDKALLESYATAHGCLAADFSTKKLYLAACDKTSASQLFDQPNDQIYDY